MDKNALAAQVAACVSNTGDLFVFGGQSFSGNLRSVANVGAEFDRQLGDNNQVSLVCGRTELVKKVGAKLPTYGDVLRDAAGNLYRIQATPSHPLAVTVEFICGSVAPGLTP